jgi:hypothetical protein
MSVYSYGFVDSSNYEANYRKSSYEREGKKLE